MKIKLAEELVGLEKIDLLGGPIGAFSNNLNDLKLSFTNNLSDAEIVLVPHDLHLIAGIPEYINYLNKLSSKKPILISNRWDMPTKLKVANSYQLRFAILPNERINNFIVVPYNVKSLTELPFREYSTSPRISFVGYQPKLTAGRMVRSIKTFPIHPLMNNSVFIRKEGAKRILDLDLRNDVVIRNIYGAAPSINRNFNQHRQEFIQSIANSDLIFSPRGDANQSQRYYEALSAGRIPIIPNTSIVFPKTINDSGIKFMILVNVLSTNLEIRIKEFWKNFDQSSYQSFQKEIRKFFNDEISYVTYINRLLNSDLQYFFKFVYKKN